MDTPFGKLRPLIVEPLEFRKGTPLDTDGPAFWRMPSGSGSGREGFRIGGGGGADPFMEGPDLTGGWILLSMTTYFWSFEAEKERVVPGFTLAATERGTLKSTGLDWGPLWGRTKIET